MIPFGRRRARNCSLFGQVNLGGQIGALDRPHWGSFDCALSFRPRWPNRRPAPSGPIARSVRGTLQKHSDGSAPGAVAVRPVCWALDRKIKPTHPAREPAVIRPPSAASAGSKVGQARATFRAPHLKVGRGRTCRPGRFEPGAHLRHPFEHRRRPLDARRRAATLAHAQAGRPPLVCAQVAWLGWPRWLGKASEFRRPGPVGRRAGRWARQSGKTAASGHFSAPGPREMSCGVRRQRCRFARQTFDQF